MMDIAERYILGRVLVITTMTMASLLAIVLITQVLIFVNVVTDSAEAIRTFFSMAAMLVPMVAGIVLPFALLIGVCHTLNTMHTDSEIVVLEAAGVSHSVVVKPVILLAVLASLASFANSVIVEPAANRNLRDIINTAGSDLIRFAVRSEAFHRLESNLYIQIGGQLPGGGFDGIFIADLREADGELIYHARRGSIVKVDDSDLLVLENGEIQRKNARTGEVSIITFTTYALDMSLFTAARSGGSYLPKEQSIAYLLSPDPNDHILRTRPHLLRSELHRRLSDWLYPVAFGLIALYFSIGARSNREERLWSLAAAAGTAVAVRGVGFFLVNNSGTTPVLAALTYLLPLACIAFFASLLGSGRRGTLSQAWLDRLGDAVERLSGLFDRAARRPLARGGGGE